MANTQAMCTSFMGELLTATHNFTTGTGDTFKVGEATYRVGRIETTPPGVEITKESPSLVQPDRRVLTPREPDFADENAAPGSRRPSSAGTTRMWAVEEIGRSSVMP